MLLNAPTLDDLGLHPSLYDLYERLDGPMRTALAIVLVCHAGHGWDLKKERRMALKWWSEFLPARVKLAALTSSTLGEFTQALLHRLRGQVGDRYDSQRGNRQRAVWQEIVTAPEEAQDAVLDVLERQASVLTTLVRADVEAWRKERGGPIDGEKASEESDGRNDNGSSGSEAAEPSLFGTGDVPSPEPGAE